MQVFNEKLNERTILGKERLTSYVLPNYFVKPLKYWSNNCNKFLSKESCEKKQENFF